MKTLGLTFLMITTWAGLLFAQDQADNKKEAFVLCRNKKNVRTVRVEKQKAEYQTIYTKSGIDKTVGQSQGYLSAFNIMKNIKTNLEGAGWTCADVQNFEVTRSTANE